MPCTWKNRLAGDEIDALDGLRLKTRRATESRTATIILMSDAGRTKASIAEKLGCGAATVERIQRLCQTMGLVRLAPIKVPGRRRTWSRSTRGGVRCVTRWLRSARRSITTSTGRTIELRIVM